MDTPSTAAFASCTPVFARRDVLAHGRCAALRRSGGVRARAAPRMTGAAPKKAAGRGRGSAGGYWPGEWICVDCGFVYKPGRRVKFEDLPSTWKCPQCSAPKRRFAKKAGELVQETAGTSNTPIVIFSAFGLLAVLVFGWWAATQL